MGGNTKIKLENAEGRKLAKIKQEDDQLKKTITERIYPVEQGRREEKIREKKAQTQNRN